MSFGNYVKPFTEENCNEVILYLINVIINKYKKPLFLWIDCT